MGFDLSEPLVVDVIEKAALYEIQNVCENCNEFITGHPARFIAKSHNNAEIWRNTKPDAVPEHEDVLYLEFKLMKEVRFADEFDESDPEPALVLVLVIKERAANGEVTRRWASTVAQEDTAFSNPRAFGIVPADDVISDWIRDTPLARRNLREEAESTERRFELIWTDIASDACNGAHDFDANGICYGCGQQVALGVASYM